MEQKGTLSSQLLPQETEDSLALVFCVPHILLFLAFLLIVESRWTFSLIQKKKKKRKKERKKKKADLVFGEIPWKFSCGLPQLVSVCFKTKVTRF